MYSKDFINSNFKLFESFGYLSQDIIQIIKTSPLVLYSIPDWYCSQQEN